MEFPVIDAGGIGATLGRLFLAALLGAVIGFEREASGKPAGFRTNLLICLGAALITEVSITVARDVTVPGGFRADPARIAAQIVSGIGFLGAGTIMQARGSVIGLTTAATMWVVAGIGMAIGAGAYAIGITASAITLVALRVLHRLDDRLLSNTRWTEQTLLIETEKDTDAGDVERALEKSGIDLQLLRAERLQDRRLLTFRARGTGLATTTSTALGAHPGILKVTID